MRRPALADCLYWDSYPRLIDTTRNRRCDACQTTEISEGFWTLFQTAGCLVLKRCANSAERIAWRAGINVVNDLICAHRYCASGEGSPRSCSKVVHRPPAGPIAPILAAASIEASSDGFISFTAFATASLFVNVAPKHTPLNPTGCPSIIGAPGNRWIRANAIVIGIEAILGNYDLLLHCSGSAFSCPCRHRLNWLHQLIALELLNSCMIARTLSSRDFILQLLRYIDRLLLPLERFPVWPCDWNSLTGCSGSNRYWFPEASIIGF